MTGQRISSDSVEYLHSKVWAGPDGRNRAGMVLIQEQRVFAARDVAKVDARPGGYVATGGHGGVIGGVGGQVGAVLCYVPVTKHTYLSEVNITRLPAMVEGLTLTISGVDRVKVAIKNAGGELLGSAIPKVSIIKDASYSDDGDDIDPSQEVDVAALIDYKLKKTPLAGFVLEGLSPYGSSPSPSRTRALSRAVYMGFPVVCVGRGNTEGFANARGVFIAGSNLTATKARLLLMLCIMKFGMLPAARNPDQPTKDELAATAARNKEFQAIFDTH